jgi:hypothetical protein
MTINFPNSPQNNDTYTLGNRTWKYNGYSWELVPLTGGYTGSQGVTGFTGSAGTNGFTGSQGDIGYTGSASTVIGYTGSQGDIGYTGSASTVAGFTGSQGIQGDIGYTGSQGDIGYTGSASTVAGFTGSQGATGFTGSSASNITVSDFDTGVVDTDISSVSASDDTLASAKAIKTYVDDQVAGYIINASITPGETYLRQVDGPLKIENSHPANPGTGTGSDLEIISLNNAIAIRGESYVSVTSGPTGGPYADLDIYGGPITLHGDVLFGSGATIDFGNATVTSLGGGTSWQSEKTASFTATAGEGYFVNTSSGAITVTLPASPTLGDEVTIVDASGTADTNNITIARNGNPIQGSATDLTISVERAGFTLAYFNSTQGWLLKDK